METPEHTKKEIERTLIIKDAEESPKSKTKGTSSSRIFGNAPQGIDPVDLESDLSAKEVITVHHSKCTLSKHPWDEPRRNEDALEAAGLSVRRLVMEKPEALWRQP